jgi:hypothetical protein
LELSYAKTLKALRNRKKGIIAYVLFLSFQCRYMLLRQLSEQERTPGHEATAVAFEAEEKRAAKYRQDRVLIQTS